METFDRFDKEALSALKARSLPRCTADSVVKPTEGSNPDEAAKLIAEVDKYLTAFLPYSNDCVCCGTKLCGLMVGTFTWGLANGEGFCGRCKYPARAIHRVGDIGTLSNFVLQYHPDGLSFDDERAA